MFALVSQNRSWYLDLTNVRLGNLQIHCIQLLL